MNSNKRVYDFVIVGSGMGGLTCGIILGMEGYSVLILEKNHQIGGSLQVFSRDKCIFDTGVHYIGSLDEGENLNQIFKYIRIMDDLPLQRLDDEQFDLVRFPGGREFKMGQGYNNFKNGLLESFPEEEEAIDKFIEKVLELVLYFPLYNLEMDSPHNYINNPELLELDAWEFVSSITDNDQLRAVLLGNGALYAGEQNITPFYVVALITNSYIKGSYRLQNGGGELLKAMSRRLKEVGGEVLKHQNIVGAEYEGKEVVAVVTDDGTKHYGNKFISNLHPATTIDVFGEDHFRAVYRNRIRKLDNTVSSFTLYLSLKEKSFPYSNFNYYDYFVEYKDVWSIVDYDGLKNDKWPQALFSCTPVRKNQGEYADALSAMAYMNFNEVKEWEDTFNTISNKGERGETYQAFKKKKEEQMISRLEERFPNLRECILGVYSSTPITYKNYIGSCDGSMYGIRKNVTNTIASQINSKTRIPNLFLTGQNLVFHGILGTSIGALVTCFNFIDQAKLIHRIKETK